MIVAAIVAILAVAAIPRFRQTSDRLRAEQTAATLAQWLRIAHEVSVAESREILWMWDPELRRPRVFEPVLSQDTTPTLQWRERPLGSRAPLAMGTIVDAAYGQEPRGCPDSSPAQAVCLHFFPDGTSEAAVLTVSLAASRYLVTVDGSTSQVLLRAGPLAH